MRVCDQAEEPSSETSSRAGTILRNTSFIKRKQSEFCRAANPKLGSESGATGLVGMAEKARAAVLLLQNRAAIGNGLAGDGINGGALEQTRGGGDAESHLPGGGHLIVGIERKGVGDALSEPAFFQDELAVPLVER